MTDNFKTAVINLAAGCRLRADRDMDLRMVMPVEQPDGVTITQAAQDGLVEALEDAIAFMAGDISGSAQRDGIIKQAQAALSAIKGDKS